MLKKKLDIIKAIKFKAVDLIILNDYYDIYLYLLTNKTIIFGNIHKA